MHKLLNFCSWITMLPQKLGCSSTLVYIFLNVLLIINPPQLEALIETINSISVYLESSVLLLCAGCWSVPMNMGHSGRAFFEKVPLRRSTTITATTMTRRRQTTIGTTMTAMLTGRSAGGRSHVLLVHSGMYMTRVKPCFTCASWDVYGRREVMFY